jgi:hypothetical protein
MTGKGVTSHQGKAEDEGNNKRCKTLGRFHPGEKSPSRKRRKMKRSINSRQQALGIESIKRGLWLYKVTNIANEEKKLPVPQDVLVCSRPPQGARCCVRNP